MPDSLISRLEKVQVEHWTRVDPLTGDVLCSGCDMRTDSPERAATHTVPQLLQEFQAELDRLREEWRSASQEVLQKAEAALEVAGRVEPSRGARSPDGRPVSFLGIAGDREVIVDGSTAHVVVRTRPLGPFKLAHSVSLEPGVAREIAAALIAQADRINALTASDARPNHSARPSPVLTINQEMTPHE